MSERKNETKQVKEIKKSCSVMKNIIVIIIMVAMMVIIIIIVQSFNYSSNYSIINE